MLTSVSAQQQDQTVAWQDPDLESRYLALVIEGKRALAQKQFVSARDQFTEALQLVKSTQGLYSPLQLAALQGITEASIRSRDWGNTDRYLSYFAYLNEKSRVYGIDYYLLSTELLSDLFLLAAGDPAAPDNGHYLVASRNTIWLAISTIESNAGANSLLLPRWLYRIALSHLYQSRLTERRGLTSYQYKSENRELISGWMMGITESQLISYNIGMEMLQRIAEVYARNGVNAESQALLLAQQGDWNTLFYRDDRALRAYRQSVALLRESGSDLVRINDFFSRPAVLPEPQLLSSLEFGKENSSELLEANLWSAVFPGLPAPGSSAITFNSEPVQEWTRVVMDYGPAPSSGSENSIRFGPLNVSLENEETAQNFDMTALEALRLRPRLLDGLPGHHRQITLEIPVDRTEAESP